MTRKVLITGANGFIGSNLCRSLAAGGYEVYGLVRRTSDLHFLEGRPVRLVFGDLGDPQSLSIPQDIDSVVHAASIVSDQASESACEAGIFNLTVNLVQRIKHLGITPRRFVYISTTLTLGYLGSGLSEERPGRPADFMPYVRAKKKCEAFLRERMESDRLPLVILRPGDTYGPNDRTSCDKILRAAERRIPIIVGTGQHRFAFCYIDNLCQSVRLALEDDRAVGRAYTVTNGILPTWREFFAGFQKAMGKPQRVYVPVCLAKTAAGIQEFWKRISPGFQPELTQYRIRRITTETTYDISRTVAELGYRPDNDTAKQIEEIVAWYREDRKKGYIK
ncbi:MAG: NAD-dependent epimerase/dehydratase family protein [Candidatus Aminicenantes bacterium]|nr:NAD-dependent epimerase/dehydratase family protein [Candidatus Aminicenantes bacterium]